MIKFDFKSPQDTTGVIKATVHKSGKLGFSSGAMKKLKLDENRYFRIATNAADPEDENIYLVEANEGEDDVFKANKAGKYYYIRIKHILDELDIDYKDDRVIYDIKREETEDGTTYYKLTRRKPIRRS